MARTGSRIRLEHVRAGGKILTRSEWVHAFTRALAAADASYFAARQEAADLTLPRVSGVEGSRRSPRPRQSTPSQDPDWQRRIAEELDREGL